MFNNLSIIFLANSSSCFKLRLNELKACFVFLYVLLNKELNTISSFGSNAMSSFIVLIANCGSSARNGISVMVKLLLIFVLFISASMFLQYTS